MSSSSSRSSASPTPTSPNPKADRLALAWRRGLTIPPRVSVPVWADKCRKLAKEAGSTSGQWRTSTVEASRGPMMAVTEPGVHVITLMVCTQLMKTAFLENTNASTNAFTWDLRTDALTIPSTSSTGIVDRLDFQVICAANGSGSAVMHIRRASLRKLLPLP